MNFRPELAQAVLDGRKTVTRRRMSSNPRSPWWRGGCSLRVTHSPTGAFFPTYAVTPGRGKPAIGRVEVLSIGAVRLGDIDDAEAAREGFAHRGKFIEAWEEINGKYDPDEIVWRVEFAISTASNPRQRVTAGSG